MKSSIFTGSVQEIQSASVTASLLSKEQVEAPAPPVVRSRPSKVRQDVCVVAASIFEGVGKDGETVGGEMAGWQGAFIVGGLSQCGGGWRSPSGVEGYGAEGVP